ncbi:cell division protein FtsQ/DivIB [Reinekea blandensis]|uniref:Cell division protein FtsQ n=1 Tax=Reinekea blandensis MED297 TaxID=314283 RepID=A4BFR1_9GAMM|nr:cell division protein FtsQ/DivIB [Reinekea blandensis]EAR08929.1 cell division protein FtsQ [Reinekea sp. MED297] [Reinekea blandensis MED297]
MAKKKTVKKGATRRREPFPLKKVLKVLGKVTGLVILAGVLITGFRLLMGLDISVMTVSAFKVESPLVYQDEAEMNALLSRHLGESLLLLDTIALARDIEALPWIRSAAVQKQWPSLLLVQVSEHEPVATWNRSAVLNNEGLPLERPVAQMTLAELSGPSGRPEEVMSHYLQFGKIFREVGFRVSSVDLKARGAWSLYLDNGIQIRLGEDQVLERSRRVVRILTSDDFDVNNIDTIDVRYPNGAAVRLKQETVEVENDIAA